MIEIPGWKPFITINPAQTETSLDDYVSNLAEWFVKHGMRENKDYQRIMLPGDVPQFFVREELYDSCVADYVAENRGSEYIQRQINYISPTSSQPLRNRSRLNKPRRQNKQDNQY